MQETLVQFLVWEVPLEKEQNIHSSILRLPRRLRFKQSACSAGDLGSKDPLEKGMATHSSILAWRIPMDKGAWQAAVYGVSKSWTRLSD